MESAKKTRLVNEIGRFIYGKTLWLEYHDKMEKCFEKDYVYEDNEKVEVCIAAIGSKTLYILTHLLNPESIEDVNYDTIVTKLEKHFYPNPDRSYYITKFHLRCQKMCESFFNYVLALRKLMEHCAFSKAQHKLKIRIVKGVAESLKRKLSDQNLTLSEIFEIGLAFDEVRTIKPAKHPRNHKARKNRERTCFRCKVSLVRLHKNEICPFEWAICSHCKIRGHVSVACKYKDIACNKCGEKGHVLKLCKKNENTGNTVTNME